MPNVPTKNQISQTRIASPAPRRVSSANASRSVADCSATPETSFIVRNRSREVAKISREVVVKSKSLVAIELKEAPFFRCVLAECAPVADDAVMLGEDTASHLNVAVGDEVWVLPME